MSIAAPRRAFPAAVPPASRACACSARGQSHCCGKRRRRAPSRRFHRAAAFPRTSTLVSLAASRCMRCRKIDERRGNGSRDMQHRARDQQSREEYREDDSFARLSVNKIRTFARFTSACQIALREHSQQIARGVIGRLRFNLDIACGCACSSGRQRFDARNSAPVFTPFRARSACTGRSSAASWRICRYASCAAAIPRSRSAICCSVVARSLSLLARSMAVSAAGKSVVRLLRSPKARVLGSQRTRICADASLT